MKRYNFLNNDDVYEALNRVRDAFLSAKDGNEVDKIIFSLLTSDERLKIGRRVIIAWCLKSEMKFEEISKLLRVGKTTILSVARSIDSNPEAFNLIFKRKAYVEEEYQNKKYKFRGSSKLVFKKKEYTGFTRKKVSRK
jgi:uncharacterized protein YerC